MEENEKRVLCRHCKNYFYFDTGNNKNKKRICNKCLIKKSNKVSLNFNIIKKLKMKNYNLIEENVNKKISDFGVYCLQEINKTNLVKEYQTFNDLLIDVRNGKILERIKINDLIFYLDSFDIHGKEISYVKIGTDTNNLILAFIIKTENRNKTFKDAIIEYIYEKNTRMDIFNVYE